MRSWNVDGVVAVCCVYGQDNSFSHKSKGKNPVRCLQYEPYLGYKELGVCNSHSFVLVFIREHVKKHYMVCSSSRREVQLEIT